MRGEERGAEDDVADVAAGERELPGEEPVVDVAGNRRPRGEERAPEALAQMLVRQGELDLEVDAPGERLVHVHREVRGRGS